MSDRRNETRAESSDRRGFPRPPLWLNVVLLLFAAAAAVLAKVHHDRLEARFQNIVRRDLNTPAELKRLRDELAATDLTQEQLKKELASRATYLQTLQSEQFYISLDTTKHRFNFNLGNETVRDAPLVVGAPATVQGNGRTWTFAPLKGQVEVVGKSQGEAWRPAPWVYLLNHQPVPADAPTIANGLGEYVIELPNGYIIHSEPPPDSPLKGAKPGSFMVPAADLRAVWPRIRSGVRVYVF